MRQKLNNKTTHKKNSAPLGANTGTIRTSGPLDYESQRFYRFRMVASDGGGLSCSSDITIGLLDENDNPPAFTQPVYNLSVSENTTVNTLLTRVQALDPDTGKFKLCSHCTSGFQL